MSKPQDDDPRPYHHGDLSQGLVDAARRLLERDGPGALSLRAVAREAGVSPAAPYHHFKDKQELLAAVASEGWEMLNQAVGEARTATPPGDAAVAELGLTYVRFALEHPALYRVMYDIAREREGLPRHQAEANDGAYAKLRATLIEAGEDPNDALDLELATIAVWCSAHGLAEMAGFRQFDRLKAACGGEASFLRGVYRHLGLVPHPATD